MAEVASYPRTESSTHRLTTPRHWKCEYILNPLYIVFKHLHICVEIDTIFPLQIHSFIMLFMDKDVLVYYMYSSIERNARSTENHAFFIFISRSFCLMCSVRVNNKRRRSHRLARAENARIAYYLNLLFSHKGVRYGCANVWMRRWRSRFDENVSIKHSTDKIIFFFLGKCFKTM